MGGVYDEVNTKIVGEDGKAINTNGAPSFGFGIDTAPELAVFNPLNLLEGRWPEVTARSSSMPARRTARTSRSARDPDLDAAAGPGLRGRRDRAVRRRQVTRQRDLRDLRRRDGAEALRPRGRVRRDLGRGQGRHDAGAAHLRHRAAPPGGRTGQDRRRGGAGVSGRDRRDHHVHPLLPARVRRDRALRRLLRDLQHAVDHRRAAHPRVRDPAHARRLSTAGAPLGAARGVRHRPPRLADRPRPRDRAREGSRRAVPIARARAPGRRDRVRAPHRDRLAARRNPDHRARRALPRHPGDPCAADRGRARGRRAPEGPLASLHAVRRDPPDRRRALPARLLDVRRRRRHRAALAFDRRRCAAPLRRRRDDLVEARATPGRRRRPAGAMDRRGGRERSRGATPSGTRVAQPRPPPR